MKIYLILFKLPNLLILIENAKDVAYETCSFSDMGWSSLTRRK